jgi:hypothetical protein
MKNEPNGTLHSNRSDSVLPFKSVLKAGITATILPATALTLPKRVANPGLRPQNNEAKPPAKIITRPQRKRDI